MTIISHTQSVRLAAAHGHAIVRASVVKRVTGKDVGHISDDALPVGVVLAGAVLPSVRVNDVDLAFGMCETQEAAGEDGDGVIPSKVVVSESSSFRLKKTCDSLVGDPVHDRPGVDEVNKGLVAHTRSAVGDSAEADTGGEVDGKVGGRDNGDRATQRVASDSDFGRVVLGDTGLHGRENGCSRPGLEGELDSCSRNGSGRGQDGLGVCVAETIVSLDRRADAGEEVGPQGLQVEVEVRDNGKAVGWSQRWSLM